MRETVRANNSVSLDDVRAIEKKLKHIRDKTHFHLDKQGVLDPTKIWQQAALSYGELEKAMNTSFLLLSLLYKELRGLDYELPEYDGSDATYIAADSLRECQNTPMAGPPPRCSRHTTADCGCPSSRL